MTKITAKKLTRKYKYDERVNEMRLTKNELINKSFKLVMRLSKYFETTTNNKPFAWKHVFSDCDTIQKVHSGVNEMYGRQVKYMIYGDYYYYYLPETYRFYNIRVKSDLSSYEQITDVEFRDFVYNTIDPLY